MKKYLGSFSIDQAPEPGTITALVSAAESHYRISVLGWALREQAAGRSPGDDPQPPAVLRREFWAAAYDQILHRLEEYDGKAYLKPLSFFRAEALAAVKD